MTVGEATVVYQQEWERCQSAWASALDDEERDLLMEDLGKARDQLEVAWLEHKATL